MPNFDSEIDDLVYDLKNKHKWNFDIYLVEAIDSFKMHSFDDIVNFICAGRAQKSIRKELYKKITSYNNNFSGYIYFLDYALFRAIKDPNLLVRAINSKFSMLFNENVLPKVRDEDMNWYGEEFLECIETTNPELANEYRDAYGNNANNDLPSYYNDTQDFNRLDALTIERFLRFMIDVYGEKRVVELMESSTYDIHTFEDFLLQISDLFYIVNSSMLNHFNKVKLSVDALHNEFIQLVNMLYVERGSNKQLSYPPSTYKLEVASGIYQIKVAKTNNDLIMWARVLQNCLASYISKETVICALLKNSKIIGAVELMIKNDRSFEVIQYSGIANMPLCAADEKFMFYWFNENKILTNNFAKL